MALYLASLWNRGLKQLGSDQLFLGVYEKSLFLAKHAKSKWFHALFENESHLKQSSSSLSFFYSYFTLLYEWL